MSVHYCSINGWCSDINQITIDSQITEDTCAIATGTSGPCGGIVGALQATAKQPPDPTRVFHQTQTCIAAGACALRCTMDNCDWLSSVVPQFVDKYLNKVEDWPQVLADCAARGTGAMSDLACANQEALYHIFHDLEPALASFGCGTLPDWQKVYTVIQGCTAQVIGGYFPGSAQISSVGTRMYRTAARALCLQKRTSAGLDPSINPPLQGQTCTP